MFNLVSYASEQATEDPLVPCTPEFKEKKLSKKKDDVSIFKGLKVRSHQTRMKC